MDITASIKELCRQRHAVILCHTYQPAEVQDIADFVGDSYGLSKQAAAVEADLIVFCGVRFMAETAAILNPGRQVVMPDLSAGCPMADMITVEELCELKAEHPGAPVVCYVNTTAAVKAESSICCTSSNAVKIVQSLPEDQEIIFVPDRFLGRFVERRVKHKMIIWDGYCPTHAKLNAAVVARARQAWPDAEVMVHPECIPETQDAADHVISTGQMCDLVKTSSCREYIVGTEQGIIHTLRKIAPDKVFHQLDLPLICPNMKKTSLEKVLKVLETPDQAVVSVPESVATEARKAIAAMLQVAG